MLPMELFQGDRYEYGCNQKFSKWKCYLKVLTFASVAPGHKHKAQAMQFLSMQN